MTNRTSPAQTHPLVVAGVLAALVAGLHWARDVLIPMALAVLLSFVLMPFVKLLQKRGLRRTPAAVLVVLVTLAIVGALVSAISVQLHDLARDLPQHRENISRKLRDVIGQGPGVIDNLLRLPDEISTDLKDPGEQAAPRGPQPAVPVIVQVEKPTGMTLLSQAAGPLVSVIGSIGLIIALTTAMLLLREDLRNRVLHLIGEGQLTSSTRALDEATTRMSRYLLIQLALNTGFGLLLGLGLAVIGVHYAFLWGVLATLLRFIPYVGTWLGALLPLLISLASADWAQPLIAGAYGIGLGLTMNYALEPILVSRSTGVSPLALIVAAAFWTWLWGPIGLILSTPLTVCLSVLGKYVPAVGFLNVLLGTEPVLDPELSYYQRLLAHDVGEAAELMENYLEDHRLEELCEQVLLPALIRARSDQERGHLDAEELKYMVQTTRELVDEQTSAAEANGVAAVEADGPCFVGCAARDESEELALYLLQRLLPAAQGRMTVIGSRATAAEVAQRIAEERPALVLIAALPPRGVAQARYLCKRLRARFPQLPLVVGCWGGEEKPEGLVRQFQAAGATQVTTTLTETLLQLTPRLHAAPPVIEAAPA